MFKKVADARKTSTIRRIRNLSAALLSLSVLTLVVITIPVTRGANPTAGTVSETHPQVAWTGQIKVPTGDSNCGGPNSADCDNFRIDFEAPSSSFGPYLLEIKLVPQGDWDMQLYGPQGNLLDGSGNSPGVVEIVTMINPPAGSYTVAAAPFAPLVGTDGNSYAATAELKHYFVNGALQGPDTNINYHNFAATGNLGSGAGEPSIGVNWNTGRVMFIALRQTLRATFSDSAVPPARVIWEDKSFVWTNLITMDPILFTDRSTGRTIVSQLASPAGVEPLAVLTNGCSISAVTDDDGDTWVPDEGCGPPSGADHQSIGGGPFADPLPRELPAPAYAHAVYYCAQSGVTAYCSRSDDGGLTYGPGVPIYTTECSGLHGHPSVGPDGTVYVPNRACGGKQGVVVSENNGVSWNVRTLPDSIQGAMDPGVAVGAGNSVYFGYQNSDGRAKVAVSHDKGLNWTASKDIGAAFSIMNSAFPRVLAGDDDRAAFAFLGTPTAGSFQDANFQGEWHLYVSHTFDSGNTWTTIDATPTDPVQRGCIWMQGGSNPCRNLLDFMGSAVDKEGRVLIGYADGCDNCSSPSTSRGSKATIARQVNGRRLFAAYDPNVEPTPTPTPTPSASPTPTPLLVIPPASQDTGPKIGFENFTAPGVLTPTLITSAGQQPNSVEYLGRSAGEPSIGNNWKTGVTAYQSDLQTLFVSFNDTCPSNGQTSTWTNRQAPTSNVINSDPIGFTDPQTGRTFAGALTLLSPSCKTSFTDDDGLHWTPTQGSGIASGVDHETIGGGPFAAPLTRPTDVPGLYPNAVYYCSQEGQDDTGFCSRSDDGGLTFGPSVPVSTPGVTNCSGLHGHVKVAPDGTVYLPVNYCDGVGSVFVSVNNGISWSAHQVQSSGLQTKPSLSFQDPAVAIDKAGRVYYIIADEDKAAAVLTSDDHGATWQNLGDVGAAYGLKNIRYPAAIAGDAGRAAVAFYGTTTPGDALQPDFDGLWHLYIAETFNGGQSWTTTDATPNAPIQRGCIWAKGGANICRNLLDFFDMTVDREGRVLVGYVNGCEGANCAQAATTAKGNAYTAAAVIARQSSGRRLFATYDPPNALAATSKPGMPAVTARRVGSSVTLGWSLADTGNSAISAYQILRSTASGTETMLTTVPGDQTRFTDTSATDTTKTYYYKVLAVNGVGTSCAANEVAAPYIGDTCTGLLIHRNEANHPEANLGMNTPASLLIDYIAVSEPAGTNNLMFKIKVNSLASIPANSRWRIAWNSFAAEAIDPDAQQFYVGMTTGPSGPPVFEYGTLADAGLPAVYAISETRRGNALAESNFNADGTITIVVPKTALGNPQAGDLLGAVNGRTFTGDIPGTPEALLERSNIMIDHTFVKAQTDNSYPAATYMIAGNTQCSATIEGVINSMVALQVSNPSTAGGKSSFDLGMKNISSQGIFTPIYLEVAQITSSSGTVTAANADNGGTGVGAAWSYNNMLGSDNTLSPNELSLARNLKFNAPNNATFTVTFNVVGTIAQTSSGAGAGGGSGSGGSGSTPSVNLGVPSIGGVTDKVFQVTYNPILHTVTVKLL